MTVSDLARGDVVTADPGTTISELAFTMANERVGGVVITEGDAVGASSPTATSPSTCSGRARTPRSTRRGTS